MIGQLNGILLEKNPPQVLVDCGGVGYEVDVPMSTFYQLPQTGERVKLLIHFVVREDAQILYGFSTPQEKAAFKQSPNCPWRTLWHECSRAYPRHRNPRKR